MPYVYLKTGRGAWWNSGARGRRFDSHSGRRVVPLSKTDLLHKSTGNTQEEMAPPQHDWQIVYCGVKQKQKKKKEKRKHLKTG